MYQALVTWKEARQKLQKTKTARGFPDKLNVKDLTTEQKTFVLAALAIRARKARAVAVRAGQVLDALLEVAHKERRLVVLGLRVRHGALAARDGQRRDERCALLRRRALGVGGHRGAEPEVDVPAARQREHADVRLARVEPAANGTTDDV